jgi:hypothetical protein
MIENTPKLSPPFADKPFKGRSPPCHLTLTPSCKIIAVV